MTKAELGTKRTCPNCGTKYYDLNRDSKECPRCGEVATAKGRPQAVKAPVAAEEPEEAAPAEAVETVSLEEADEEIVESGAVKPKGGDVDIDDDAVDDDDEENSEEEAFLPAEEDEDDEDVGDIIGDVDEDDT